MQIELNDGTEVRFVNGGSLSGAAYDFNCGDPAKHLHVYLALNPASHGFAFLCADRSFGRKKLLAKLEEAEHLLEEKILTEQTEQEQLLLSLLANTNGIIEEMQGAIPDNNYAPVHVRLAVGFERYGAQKSWADVKAQLTRLKAAPKEPSPASIPNPAEPPRARGISLPPLPARQDRPLPKQFCARCKRDYAHCTCALGESTPQEAA